MATIVPIWLLIMISRGVIGDQPQPNEGIVDNPLLLQHDFPGGGSHQKGRPEWQKDQYHQQVRYPHRQCRQQITDRISKQDTSTRNHERHEQSTSKKLDEDLLVFGLGLRAFRGSAHVDGIQEVTIGNHR